MAAPGYAAADLLAVAGMLGMGTIKTLLSKLMYGIQTRGIDGTVHSFEARALREVAAAPVRRMRVRCSAPRRSRRQASRPAQRGPPGLAFLRCRTAGLQPLAERGLTSDRRPFRARAQTCGVSRAVAGLHHVAAAAALRQGTSVAAAARNAP